MKLLYKTSLIYLIASVIVFCAGGIVFYYNLQSLIDEEVNEKLEVAKERVEKFIEKEDTLPALSYEANAVDFIRPSNENIPAEFSDTTYFSREEGEALPYRMYTFPVKWNGHQYAVRLSKPLFESDDLFDAIISSFAVIVGMLLVVILLLNWVISGKLWKPFFLTLSELKEFRIDTKKEITLPSTSTKEFGQLNASILSMTEKAKNDFQQMRSFTENASHELQTPLSVILAESEEMLQSTELNEKQLEAIRSINQTARKLSRLNQSLLLLAKISNRQFQGVESADMTTMVRNKLAGLADLIEFRGVNCSSDLSDGVKWDLHPVLADILVNNLVSNAIRHTETNGNLEIKLTSAELTVSNSGKELEHPEHIFERFYKESHSNESTGLGLAIVKQICDTSGMKASYFFEDGRHVFRIST